MYQGIPARVPPELRDRLDGPVNVGLDIEEFHLDEDMTDEELHEYMQEKVVAREEKMFLAVPRKKIDKTATILHVITRCQSCQHVLMYNMIVPGPTETVVLIENLAEKSGEGIIPLILKTGKCKKHGYHRYAGYIMSGLGRTTYISHINTTLYMILSVTTKDTNLTLYELENDEKPAFTQKEITREEPRDSIIKLFRVTPKKKDTRDMPMYR